MPKLIDQNIVVLGSLNPTILHPQWLGKIKVLESKEKVEAKIKIGANFPSEFRGDKFKWSLDYSRLQVSLNSPNENSTNILSEFVYKIFKELPHTPITALGENFEFEIESMPEALVFLEKKEWEVGGKTTWGSVSTLQHNLSISVDETSKIFITIVNENQKTSVKFNFHFDVSDTEKLGNLCKDIDSNMKKAKNILEEIVKK